jgi:hypothetical protein
MRSGLVRLQGMVGHIEFDVAGLQFSFVCTGRC